MGPLEKCAYCEALSSGHCTECKKPLCKTHVKIFADDNSSSPIVLCEKGHLTKEDPDAGENISDFFILIASLFDLFSK